jgi:hypothetical protein
MALRAWVFGCITEESSGFNHNLYTQLCPGQLSGVAFCKNFDLLSIYDKIIAFDLYGSIINAVV